MKKEEKNLAIRLRKEGESMGEIARKIGVSKASVSLWVRNVALSIEQRQKLNLNGFSIDAIEKRRLSRLDNTKKRHSALMEKAARDIPALSARDLWLIGTALYWGEGGKTMKGMARLSNSDPAVIQTTMRFFREICQVPEEKFRGHVHTFSHLNSENAEQYWSGVSKIPRNQFFKPYVKPSIASKNKRDTLPYGTFQVYVNDTKLFLKIMGWISRIKELNA